MADRIIISGLAVDCIVGTLPHERERPQRILLDIEILCDLEPAGKADDLALAPDYAKAARMAREFCAGRKALLIEALAEGVAALLLAEFPVRFVRVKVTKPAAIPDAAAAAVEILRTKT